jgi:type II secretory pathway pseudopilin PulG
MRKIIMLVLFTVLVIGFLSGVAGNGCEQTNSARQVAQQAQEASAIAAIQAVPIPTVSYFQEKRTIAKWASRWDKPSVPTYVYLVSFGKILGYYVADGKPASTKSYLMPEEEAFGNSSAGFTTLSTPDIDGTYGDNNPGIRFFTAEGAAVEWAGDGASYLYSDTLINFGYDVPKLNREE